MRILLRWLAYVAIMAVVVVAVVGATSMFGRKSAEAPACDMASSESVPMAAPSPAPPSPPAPDVESIGTSGRSGTRPEGAAGGGAAEVEAEDEPAEGPKVRSGVKAAEGDVKSLDEPSEDDAFAAVDRALEKLVPGNIAFNTPDAMEVDETASVQLLLSPKETIEELKEMVTAEGRKEGARIQVSDRMLAELTGSGFTIKAITPAEQAVSRKLPTEWRWDVTATESGSRRLHLTLSAVITISGERTPRVVRTFEKTMEIGVAWPRAAVSFLGDNWEWLWATFLVPVGGEVLRRRRRHTGGEAKPAA